MPRLRGLMLAAILATFTVSCARAPPRDTKRSPASSDRAPGTSAAQPDDARAAALQRADEERSRVHDRGAVEHGPMAETSQRPTTPAEVREAVSRVVSGWGLPAYGNPQALRAIAGMLERVAGDDSTTGSSLVGMRRAIGALEHLGRTDLDRADHLKDALERGVETLGAVARSQRAGWLEPWVEAAATAADAIDPATPLGLQRAAVQDALRSLADAVLVAEQFADR